MLGWMRNRSFSALFHGLRDVDWEIYESKPQPSDDSDTAGMCQSRSLCAAVDALEKMALG
jgi:hypothetical protein